MKYMGIFLMMGIILGLLFQTILALPQTFKLNLQTIALAALLTFSIALILEDK